MQTVKIETQPAEDEDDLRVVSPAGAREELDCGQTKLYELINAGELETYLDGGARKITRRSIRAYKRRLLAASRKAA